MRGRCAWKALRLRTKQQAYCLPGRNYIFVFFRGLRPRLPSLRSVLPSRQLPRKLNAYTFIKNSVTAQETYYLCKITHFGRFLSRQFRFFRLCLPANLNLFRRNGTLCPSKLSLSASKIFLFPWYFSLSAKTFFVTNFVTLVTNLLTHVTNFVIHVTNFVTNFFL